MSVLLFSQLYARNISKKMCVSQTYVTFESQVIVHILLLCFGVLFSLQTAMEIYL